MEAPSYSRAARIFARPLTSVPELAAVPKSGSKANDTDPEQGRYQGRTQIQHVGGQ